ncbi:DNA polymerase III, delta subunit [Candidatus Vecturithrix granuli]|uniref:DNA polymerase III subunit delta n=1 Tax=Vecturithrix granuli TaxID=1499967 RepID=A0A081C9J6_VECG1|nr:DNA polymerase III, delta subunit [Candidatus Vecturithrix granuli]
MAARKEYITYAELLKHLDQGMIKPVYLFQGQETFLIEECVERLKQTLIPPESADFNVDKFAGKDMVAADVLDLAQTIPFLSKWRLIIVTDIDDLSAEAQKQMLPYLSHPNPSTCLVFTGSKLDSRTKFAQVLKKAGEIVQFWKLFDRDLPQWISARAKLYGCRISLQTAAYLSEVVGNELRQLDNELKKVVAYASDKELTPAVVERVVGNVRERDIFEMIDAVSTGNLVDALRILRQLLTEGEEPLKILALLSRQFRLLWKTKVHLVEQKSLSVTQIANKIGVSPKLAENLQKQVQRFSQIKLKQGLKRLYEVDLALKSSTNSPNILLEDLLIDLCT